jgi:acid phosphatase class B
VLSARLEGVPTNDEAMEVDDDGMFASAVFPGGEAHVTAYELDFLQPRAFERTCAPAGLKLGHPPV